MSPLSEESEALLALVKRQHPKHVSVAEALRAWEAADALFAMEGNCHATASAYARARQMRDDALGRES